MFDSIISNITHFVRNTVRALRTALNRMPWLAPAAIVALFLVW